MPKTHRIFAFVALVTLVAAVGCRRSRPATTEEPEETPSPTPAVESLGEFQLVGLVEQAFLSISPGLDLPEGETEQPPEGTAGRVAADVNGVMRVTLEALSDNLAERCQADEGDRLNVFWEPDALFDEALVSGSNPELTLEGRRIGAIGSLFLRPEAGGEEPDEGEDQFDLNTPSPTGETPTQATTTPEAGPGATTAEGEENCVLRAEQVGTSRGALPTPRPRARAQATAPAATRTPIPTAARTASPAPTPTRRPPTPTPTETPTDEPTPTDSPTPEPS